MRNFVLIAAIIGFCTSTLLAQVLKPVKWSMEQLHVSGDEFDLLFNANMEKNWVIYSQFTDEGGPNPTSFNFDEGPHFEKIGPVKEEGNKKEGKERLFGDVNVVKFVGGHAPFRQRIKVLDYSKPITGYLEFMTCNDELCLPPTEVDFSFSIEDPNGAVSSENAGDSKGSDIGATKQTRTEEFNIEKGPEPAVEEPEINLVEKITEVAKPDVALEEQSPEKVIINDPQVLSYSSFNESGSGGENPTQWNMQVKKLSENEFELTYNAAIKKGFNIYSFFQEEGGPIPVAFYYDEENTEVLGETIEASPKKEAGYDKLFDMDVIKLKESARFVQRIKVKDPSKPMDAALDYMVCDDEACVPYMDTPTRIDFVNLKGAIGSSQIEEMFAGLDQAAIGPKLEGNELDSRRASLQATYLEPLGDCGSEDTAAGQNYFWTFILGFAGGLLALLTPCVFPMIPLTVSFFTKGSTDRKSGIRNGLIYGFSIIVIYVAIGLLITAAFGPTALNELSTNATANVIFFLIFLFFAFSFFGYYELTLPSSWANKSDKMAEAGGLLGIFFMAFTLAIVSFSCTGPIIGSAIVASAQSAVGPAIVMLGFATALALPFGLFAAFPAWLNSLPRSGSWMNSVKVVLGFLELALAFKFLSVADMTYHWNILGYEIFMAIWILCAAGMTLYLFGLIKFPHDSPLKKLSKTRWAFALGSLALTIYLCAGFLINDKTKQYQSLKLLSGIAPPAYYNYFRPDIPETQVNPDVKARYASYSKCANNLDCFKDYYEGISYAAEINKPVLLDFTGFGCVNCRKTEEHIWVEDQVWNKLKDDFVLISLYVDDRKKLEQTFISKNSQEPIRNVGKKWADFQIVNFNQNSQPLYVMMTPDEKVLAKPRGYKEGANDYAEFLECGLNTYNQVTGKVIGSK